MRERRCRQDPGRVIRDLAVMLADGGDCLADLRAVRDQQPLVSVGRALPRQSATSVLFHHPAAQSGRDRGAGQGCR
jgi:hypothetical protein